MACRGRTLGYPYRLSGVHSTFTVSFFSLWCELRNSLRYGEDLDNDDQMAYALYI